MSNKSFKKVDHTPRESKTFIDPDKVASMPGLMSYAHHVGSSVIKVEDRVEIKNTALRAMYEQTDNQFQQIKEQMELLAQQANAIQKRVEISEMVYQSKLSFKPLIGQTYHLYQQDTEEYSMSMVGPEEWGRSRKPIFVASVRLMADHTWELLGNTEKN